MARRNLHPLGAELARDVGRHINRALVAWAAFLVGVNSVVLWLLK